MEPTQEFYMVWTDDFGFEASIWNTPEEALQAASKLATMAAYRYAAIEVRMILLHKFAGQSIGVLATPSVIIDRTKGVSSES
jgi:hypothetical protein